MLNIQRTIIHSLMICNREALSTLEIKKYLFPIPLHEKVINCVQWLYTNGQEIDEEIVFYYIKKHYEFSVIDMQEHLEIISTNPLTINTCRKYLELLEDNYNHNRGHNV